MQKIETNLHELSKVVIAQLPKLNEEGLNKLIDEIEVLDNGSRRYFMLLSNEKRDFTVFHLNEFEKKVLGKEVIDVLNSRGVIKEYEVINEHEAIEIWVDDVYYALFPYDLGVVEI